MQSKANPKSGDQVLRKVERTFAAFRRRNSGERVRYPSHLKSLATSAISVERRPGVVARAAGVSAQTLSQWQRTVTEQPRELRVVAAKQVATVAATSCPVAVARVRLPSGVMIEIPVSALSPSLVAVFARSAVLT